VFLLPKPETFGAAEKSQGVVAPPANDRYAKTGKVSGAMFVFDIDVN